MDAVILDVGGVLLIPHHEAVGEAFTPLGIHLDARSAERAHYFGARAMDAAPPEDEREARRAYLVGYAEGAGVPRKQVEEALEHMRRTWGQPTIDIWRQHVSGSLEGLRQLEATGVKLGI